MAPAAGGGDRALCHRVSSDGIDLTRGPPELGSFNLFHSGKDPVLFVTPRSLPTDPQRFVLNERVSKCDFESALSIDENGFRNRACRSTACSRPGEPAGPAEEVSVTAL